MVNGKNKIVSRSGKTGLSPGSLVHVGKKKTEKVKIHVMDYTENDFIEKDLKKIEESFEFKNKSSVTWINIDGIHDTEIMKKIGDYYGIHSLFLEDILNTDQRPKIEIQDDYMIVICKMLTFKKEDLKIDSEQISIILGKNFVISFQEKEGDLFDPIRERIRNGTGRVRKMGADYLAYLLLDVTVDNYFKIIEQVGERLIEIEDKLIAGNKKPLLKEIYHLKRELLVLRKSVWPLREVINRMEKEETDLIKNKTDIFLRDLYEHTVHVIDELENFQYMISGIQDLQISTSNSKMNEIMKVLTIISTIFIPLTFIAGLYGMNFHFMPELTWKYGYFLVLEIMSIAAMGMLLYFKRKKWL